MIAEDGSRHGMGVVQVKLGKIKVDWANFSRHRDNIWYF